MWRKRLSVLMVSSALALLAVEIGFRLSASEDYRNRRYWRYCQPFGLVPGALAYDPSLGFFHNPNLDLRFTNDEFDTRVLTNSLGFRDDEASLDQPEVLFLGDSFCFGWGVEDDETCESIFEKRSGRLSLNMGVAGFHTLQQWLLYRRFCLSNDIRNATVVLLAFCDDPAGSATRFLTFPRLRLSGGKIEYASPAEEMIYREFLSSLRNPWLKRISRHSFLGDLIIEALHRPEKKMRRFSESPRSGDDDGVEVDLAPPPFEAFEFLLKEMLAFSAKRNNRFFVALVPRLEDIRNQPNPEHRAMESILTRVGVAHLLLVETLQTGDYLPLDRHWNAAGHRHAAEAILRSLRNPNFD